MPNFICDYCGNVENTARTYWYYVHGIPICTCCIDGDKWHFHQAAKTKRILEEDIKCKEFAKKIRQEANPEWVKSELK